MPGPDVQVFCSGSHAEKLLGCSAYHFSSKKAIRDKILVKWVDLVNTAVQLSLLVATKDSDSKEFHIIDCELC